VTGGGTFWADGISITWANHSNLRRGAKQDGLLIKDVIELLLLRYRMILDGQPDDAIVQKLDEAFHAIPDQHG
jgi:hypothetical protein